MTIVTINKDVKHLEIRQKTNYTPSDPKYKKLYQFLSKYENDFPKPILSIVLPVFNEEKSIKNLLEDLPQNKNIEIIVVDDHSTDDSVKEILKLKEHMNLELYKHRTNRGYGGAIITGVNKAKGEVIVTMDSDGQHNPLDIISVIKPVFEGTADYTIGSRYLGANHYDLPLITRLGEAVVEKFIQIFFNERVMNNQNGFRAFKRKIIPLFSQVKYSGFTFATEIILKLVMEDYKIEECPIKVYHRQFGSSKINIKKLTLNLFSCLFRYYIKKVLRFKKIL